MNQVDSHNSIQRIFVGGIALLLTLLVIYFSNTHFGHYLLLGVMCGVVLLSLMEFYTMTKAKGHEPIIWLGVTSSLILLFIKALEIPPTFFSYIGVLLITLFISYLVFFNRGSNPLTNLSITLFGIVYLSIPLSFILLINRTDDDARAWLLYLLIVTKMTDIFAYIIGKKWGNKPLAPMISPKKTIEGAVGGFLFAVLSSICFYYYFHYLSPTFTLLDSIVLGSVISILAQIGDLAESLLKRDAGIKDSNSLPGLGGMLDIVDSLIFTSPALYYFLVFSQ